MELRAVAEKENIFKARKIVKPDISMKAHPKEERKAFLKTKLDNRRMLNVNRKRKKVAKQRGIKNITKTNIIEVEQQMKKDERTLNLKMTKEIESTKKEKKIEKSPKSETADLPNSIKTKAKDDESVDYNDDDNDNDNDDSNGGITFFNLFKNINLPNKNYKTLSKPYFSYVVVL